MGRAILVYQAGIANVFRQDAPGLPKTRLLQGTFGQAEMFARGLKAAGVVTEVAYCNEAGDIMDSRWHFGLPALADAPFRGAMHPEAITA